MKEVGLEQLSLLFVPGEKEKYLCLKSVSFGVMVKILQKRILRELLEHDVSSERLAEHRRKRSLACADNTFDGDVTQI
jgi:hypothetical protein